MNLLLQRSSHDIGNSEFCSKKYIYNRIANQGPVVKDLAQLPLISSTEDRHSHRINLGFGNMRPTSDPTSQLKVHLGFWREK